MSHLLEKLARLAARARLEDAPVVDVASEVVSRLGHEGRKPAWPLVFFASSALACSAIVLGFSLPIIEMVTDPWCDLFLAATEVLR